MRSSFSLKTCSTFVVYDKNECLDKESIAGFFCIQEDEHDKSRTRNDALRA